MTATGNIFKHQIWHLLLLLVLILTINLYISGNPGSLRGALWHASTEFWLWLAIAVPVIHQVYVLLIWRLELYGRVFTRRLGLKRAFALYAAGFSVLFAGRLIVIIFLAVSNRDTLHVDRSLAYAVAALMTPVVVYLFYSVRTYFTFERALGIDHFDPDYRKPFVKRGIFRYTDNGMYVFGLMVLYLPGLLLLSEAALLAALFNHIYIWVHYYCTERPDMIEIYGRAP